MVIHPKKLAGRIRWAAMDLYRETFVDCSDQKRLKRALHRLQDIAHQQPLRPDGRKVLFFSLRPWITFLAHESILAARFREQGHSIAFYTCRNDLAFCMAHNTNMPETVRTCQGHRCLIKDQWIDARYPIHAMGAMSEEAKAQCRIVDELELADCATYAWRDVAIGDLCTASVIWYLRRTKMGPDDVDIWRTFLKSGIHVVDRFAPYLEKERPDVVVFLMGAFFSEALGLELCRQRGIRAVCYGRAHGGRLLAGQNKSMWASRDLDREPLEQVELAPSILRKGRQLLDTWVRDSGHQGYLLWKGKKAEVGALDMILGDDPRPIAVAYTNTTYETAILRNKRIFKDQFEWTVSLVNYFRSRPDQRLIIRVHPAEEVKDEWRVGEWYIDRMKEFVSEWPENITVVPPSSPLSSYDLAHVSHVGLTYISTIGMELVHRGVPVITAGCCHYDNRGFTTDPDTEEAYHAALECHLKERQPVTQEQRDALVRYVAWLYYVRLSDFEPLEQGRRESYLRCRKIKPRQVFSGRLPCFEALCALILDGREWWSLDGMISSGHARPVHPRA